VSALRPVVFDMDGVLVDSEPLYEAGFVSYMNAIGRPELAAWYPNTLGRRQADFVPELVALVDRDEDEVVAGLRAAVAPHLEGELPAMAGVPDAVRAIADGRTVGLASSSRAPFVDTVLRRLGLDDVLAVRATGDEVAHGKPHPDLYLLAAERLGIDPATAIAIEDTPAGAASAKAAGMEVIAIPNDHTRDLDLNIADVVLKDLNEAASWLQGHSTKP
jgi:beta-phosphoglucomutase-like phosphatase (HAD superfamily)